MATSLDLARRLLGAAVNDELMARSRARRIAAVQIRTMTLQT